MLELFAVTNRGLESISAQEMAQQRGVHVTHSAYRRVHATYAGPLHPLLKLRTVDDVFIQLAEWQGIGPQRSALATLSHLALDLDLWQAANARAEIHALGQSPNFSISANFVGRRNYTADEIKLALANSVEAISGWHYTDDDAGAIINLRVFIEHEYALVGMRLANTPLHKRAYKLDNRPGALKPSVAAAMLMLAHAAPTDTILDPCCGTGTILIEAAAMGHRAIGGDLDVQAIDAAHHNATAAHLSNSHATFDVRVWDARALPLADHSVPRIVTNLPWGRQVQVDSALEEFYRAACAEMARVLVPGGRIVLLTNHAELITFNAHLSEYQIEQRVEISLFGQQPTILTIVAATEKPVAVTGF